MVISLMKCLQCDLIAINLEILSIIDAILRRFTAHRNIRYHEFWTKTVNNYLHIEKSGPHRLNIKNADHLEDCLLESSSFEPRTKSR